MRPVYLGSGLAVDDANREGMRRMNKLLDTGVRTIASDMLATGSTVLA